MFNGIFQVLLDLINELVMGTVGQLIEPVFLYATTKSLSDYDINIVLFSDLPILQADLYTLTIMFFTYFYSVFFIVLLYKTTKKVIKSIFGVLKWW